MEINTHSQLIACFLEQGFNLDFNIIQGKGISDADKNLENDLYKKYLDDHNKMLFYFGFIEHPKNLSISIAFLHNDPAYLCGTSKTSSFHNYPQ